MDVWEGDFIHLPFNSISTGITQNLKLLMKQNEIISPLSLQMKLAGYSLRIRCSKNGVVSSKTSCNISKPFRKENLPGPKINKRLERWG